MKLKKVPMPEGGFAEEGCKPSVHIDCANSTAAECNVGDEVTLVIKGTVKSTRQSDSDWGAPGSISVEYDRIGLEAPKTEEEYQVDEIIGED